MNLPSGESLARQIIHGQRYFESRFGRRCSRGLDPRCVRLPGVDAAVVRGRRHAPVRHAEALVEHDQPLPAPHVLVGGARRHAGADPLPAGRHVQRRDDASRVRRLRRPLPRRGLVELVADAVRARRRRRRSDAGDARAGAPDGRPRRCAAGVGRLAGRVLRACRARGVRRRAGAGVARRAVLRDPPRHADQPAATKVGNRRCERLLREVELWCGDGRRAPAGCSTSCGGRC